MSDFIQHSHSANELDRSYGDKRFVVGKPRRQDEPLITMNAVPFMRSCNISVIQGRPKTGKTYLSSMIAAAGVAGRYENFATASEEPLGKVIFFDTEQSEGDAGDVFDRILKMSGVPNDVQPENLDLVSLRTLDYNYSREIVNHSILNYNPDLVIIDGITDLLCSPNNEEESKACVQWLYQLAEKTNVHIMVVIHENANIGDKARGHIGSELERKIETSMRILAAPGTDELVTSEEKRGERRRVKFRQARKVQPDDFCYVVDAEGIPHFAELTAADRGTPAPSQSDIDRQRLAPLFANGESYTFNALRDALVASAGVNINMAKTLIVRAKNRGLLTSDNGSYMLNNEGC